jgi:mannose-6-phosphate isomerase-like protein (cupin superfamily)
MAACPPALVPLRAGYDLANYGTKLVALIEVQMGDHLDESDIVRLEDIYNCGPEPKAEI